MVQGALKPVGLHTLRCVSEVIKEICYFHFVRLSSACTKKMDSVRRANDVQNYCFRRSLFQSGDVHDHSQTASKFSKIFDPISFQVPGGVGRRGWASKFLFRRSLFCSGDIPDRFYTLQFCSFFFFLIFLFVLTPERLFNQPLGICCTRLINCGSTKVSNC